MRETYGNTFRCIAISPSPWTSPVNRFTILLQPSTQRLQTAHLNRRNGSVRLRTNIEQEVSILADNVDQQVNQLIRRDRFRLTLGAIVAKRAPQSAAFLPLGWTDFVE